MTSRLLWWTVASAVCACQSTPTSGANKASATASASAASKAGPTVADVTWTPPTAWGIDENATQMRKATYKIPRVSGDSDDASVVVIQAGGTVEANIERWFSQFDSAHDKRRNDLALGPLKVTVAEVHGTYTGGGMMIGTSPEPKKDWVLVGAIVPTTSQPYFFKMLGPEKTVASARGDFQTLVDSIKPATP